jgi:hypothetical protein
MATAAALKGAAPQSGAVMKYLLLMYAEEGAWPPEEHQVALAESIEICHQIHAEGQYRDASPLQPPATAKCVRVRDGEPIVSDGPYAETKEQLGGFYVLECKDLDEGLDWAKRIPLREGAVEVRPVMVFDE